MPGSCKGANAARFRVIHSKSAIPIVRGYHEFLLTRSGGVVPDHTIVAMVKIAPDDEVVQREVLKLVGAPASKLALFGTSEKASRRRILLLVTDLRLEDKHKVAPMLAGFIVSGDPSMIGEIVLLKVDNKTKFAALIKSLSIMSASRAYIITELARLGPDAKDALPLLKSLKTDPEESVRNAASAALETIKE